MNNNNFVNFNFSKTLKELGYNNPSLGFYHPNGEFQFIDIKLYTNFPYLCQNSEWQDLCSAPLWQEAFNFMLEKYFKGTNLNISLYPDGTYSLKVGKERLSKKEYLTPENCLKELIKLVKI